MSNTGQQHHLSNRGAYLSYNSLPCSSTTFSSQTYNEMAGQAQEGPVPGALILF